MTNTSATREALMNVLYSLNNGMDEVALVLNADAYLTHTDTGTLAAMETARDAVYSLIERLDEVA